jgi:UTP--glucose-1-phosphate uridylyltransferase
VFPIAGKGTRFLPATKAVPKEMLPVVDKPLLQYAVEEALAAGVERLVFITAGGKTAMVDHFDMASDLMVLLKARGKQAEIEAATAMVLEPGRILAVRQPEALGLGHAVWCARHVIGHEPFAVLLPDELLWNPANPALAEMVELHDRLGGNLISVLEVPDDQTHRYGIVTPGGRDGLVTEVRGLVEKPAAGTAPSRLAAIGRYILQPEIIPLLEEARTGAGGEIQLTDAMERLIGRQPFHAVTFMGERFDCGDKAGYITANVALALERPDIGPAVQDWLDSRTRQGRLR